jgi:hypothetical protein
VGEGLYTIEKQAQGNLLIKGEREESGHDHFHGYPPQYVSRVERGKTLGFCSARLGRGGVIDFVTIDDLFPLTLLRPDEARVQESP